MKTVKYLTIISALCLCFFLNGCILDALDTLIQNFSYSAVVSVSGTQSSVISSTNFYIPESAKSMQDYTDKLKKIQFNGFAQFRDSLVTPANLEGRVKLDLKLNGTSVFSQDLGRIKIADYKTTPYRLNFTAQQLQLVNSILEKFKTSGAAFTATISATEITPAAGQKSFVGVIDVVFEGTVE